MQQLDKYIERVPAFFWFLLLAILTMAAHWFAIPIGLFLHDSDLSVPLLASEHFRQGDVSAFYFQQEYGGTVMSLLRAGWVELAEGLFGRDAYVSAHMYFSYWLGPVLATFFSYICAKKYCSPFGALLAASVSAISFQGMIQHGGDDFYYAFFIGAPVLLFIAANRRSAFLELTKVKLLFAAMFSGFMFYTFRGSLIYIVAAFLPLTFVISEIKMLFSPRDKLHKVIIGLVAFLLGLYLYLDFFGANLGLLNGKAVKLYPEPNLQIIAVLLIFLEIKLRFRDLRPLVPRFLIFGFGFFTGLLPEIVHRFNHSESISLQNWNVNTFMTAIDVIANRFSVGLRQLIVGHEYFNVYDGLLKNAPLMMFVVAGAVLLIVSVRSDRYRPILFAGMLSFVAYLRVHMSGPGHYRYLIPILPAFALSVGILWDAAGKQMTKRVLILVLVLLAFSYQIIQREAVMRDVLQKGKVSQIYEIVDYFRAKDVPVVISDEFYESNHYSFLSRERPFFVSVGRQWGPPKGFELASKEKRVGVLSIGVFKIAADQTLELFGHRVKLTEAKSVGNKTLYVAESI